MTATDLVFQRARLAVTLSMFAMGFAVMATATRLAEIKQTVGVGDQAFGTAVGLGAIGGLLGTLTAARIADWIGTRALSLLSGSVMMIAAGSNGLVQNVQQLAAVAMVTALGYSMMNVAINAQGVEVERHLGRSVMPGFHAAWSIGALTAALGGNFLAGVLAPKPHLLGNSALALAVLWASSARLLANGVHAGEAPLAQHAKISRESWRALIIIAIATTIGLFPEAANGDWSAIHIHEDLGIGLGLNSLGVTAFLLAQITGRLFGGRLNDRFGTAAVVRASAIFGGTAYSLAVVTSWWLMPNSNAAFSVMLVGIFGLGLGVSLMPAAFFSAAGHVPGVGAARGIARVALLLNLIMLIEKPALALLAEQYGLTWALLATGLGLFLVARLSTVLKPQPAL